MNGDEYMDIAEVAISSDTINVVADSGISDDGLKFEEDVSAKLIMVGDTVKK